MYDTLVGWFGDANTGLIYAGFFLGLGIWTAKIIYSIIDCITGWIILSIFEMIKASR